MRIGGLRRRAWRIVLAHRKGFAGHDGFVELEIFRFQYNSICRNEIAGSQQDDIARHEAIDRLGHRLSIAKNVRTNRDRVAKGFRRLLGAILLHDIECHGDRENRDDDEETSKIPAEAGDRGGRDQQRDEGIENPLAKLDQERLSMGGLEPVRSVDL